MGQPQARQQVALAAAVKCRLPVEHHLATGSPLRGTAWREPCFLLLVTKSQLQSQLHWQVVGFSTVSRLQLPGMGGEAMAASTHGVAAVLVNPQPLAFAYAQAQQLMEFARLQSRLRIRESAGMSLI